jgi:hypothetical protein
MACACKNKQKEIKTIIEENERLGGNIEDRILSNIEYKLDIKSRILYYILFGWRWIKDIIIKIFKIIFIAIIIPLVIVGLILYITVIEIANNVFGKNWGVYSPISMYSNVKKHFQSKANDYNSQNNVNI